VVVTVPPSPVCPHQVDGRYFGRSDTVSYRLSDPEIVRYLQRRTSWSTAATRMLDELETDDPGSDADRDVGRLYLVAQPVLAARDSAVEFLAEPERLLPVVRRESGYVGRELDLDPDLSSLSYYTPTAEGAAYRSRGRDDLSKETHRLEVELREDGGIRVLSGRMTAQRPERDPSKIILDQRVVAFAHRLVAWAVDVSSQINYGATWALGIRATGLKDGISAKLAPQFGGFDAPPYTGTSYTATTEAVVAELTDNPQAVVQRLVGKLIRSLGATTFYQRELGLNQAP